MQHVQKIFKAHGRSVWWEMTYVFVFLVWFFSPFPVNRIQTWFIPGSFRVQSWNEKKLCHLPRQRSAVKSNIASEQKTKKFDGKTFGRQTIEFFGGTVQFFLFDSNLFSFLRKLILSTKISFKNNSKVKLFIDKNRMTLTPKNKRICLCC